MGRGWGQVGVVRPGLQASPCEPAPHFQDLFFHYVFNNFLHTQVEVCVSTMLSVGLPSDNGLETPDPNPVVKHVSWSSWVPASVPQGVLCPLSVPRLS